MRILVVEDYAPLQASLAKGLREAGWRGERAIELTAKQFAMLELLALRSGEVGNLVANDFNSSIIYVPLLDVHPKTNKPLDYADFSRQLEEIRTKYNSTGEVKLHIVGFAKVVGNMIDAIGVVGIFFAIAVVLTLVLLYLYTR